jgi:hypothetical protein
VLMYSVNVCYYKTENASLPVRALSRAIEIGEEVVLGFAE